MILQSPRLHGLLIAAIAFGSLHANAAVVVNYDLSGNANSAIVTSPATTVAAGITGSDLTRGAGVNATGLTNGFSADGWSSINSLETSLSAGAYFQFGFAVQPGYQASLSTLDLSLRRSATTAPSNLQIQASVDNFATPGTVISSFTYLGRTSGTAPSPDPLIADPFYYMTNDLPGRSNATTASGDPIPQIDLSSSAFLQGLIGGSEVQFRLYAWGNVSTPATGTNTLGLGRIVGPSIGGTVTAIPEPGSLILFGSIATSGLLRRRYHQRKHVTC